MIGQTFDPSCVYKKSSFSIVGIHHEWIPELCCLCWPNFNSKECKEGHAPENVKGERTSAITRQAATTSTSESPAQTSTTQEMLFDGTSSLSTTSHPYKSQGAEIGRGGCRTEKNNQAATEDRA